MAGKVQRKRHVQLSLDSARKPERKQRRLAAGGGMLRYVLLNRRHHAAERYAAKNWIDPWSSAAWFAGWRRPLVVDTWWKKELVEIEAPTRRPTTWLLSTRWKRLGLIDFDDRPA